MPSVCDGEEAVLRGCVSFLAGVVLLLAGCQFEVPLTAEHGIAVDRAVLGVWEPVVGEGERPAREKVRLTVLPFSETEYLVSYRHGESAFYFRGYLVELGGVRCVQLQVIGSHQGPVHEEARHLYHVFAYDVVADVLQTRAIHDKLIGSDLQTSDELQAAFLEHKDDADLWLTPDRWRRVMEDEVSRPSRRQAEEPEWFVEPAGFVDGLE